MAAGEMGITSPGSRGDMMVTMNDNDHDSDGFEAILCIPNDKNKNEPVNASDATTNVSEHAKTIQQIEHFFNNDEATGCFWQYGGYIQLRSLMSPQWQNPSGGRGSILTPP